MKKPDLIVIKYKKELTENVEKEFFKALSLLKSKDQKIYDKENCKFFENMSQEESSDDEEKKKKPATSKKEKKPFLMKDFEREMILEK